MLIENAFNPQNRRADEIERYLETLLKAYDVELEAIRKRTKVRLNIDASCDLPTFSLIECATETNSSRFSAVIIN